MIYRRKNTKTTSRRALPALLLSLGSLAALTTSARAQYTVRVIGSNIAGQAGNGTQGNHSASAIQPISGPLAYTAISSGGKHSMAIAMDGHLYVWGENNYGQLGDSTLTAVNTPEPTAFTNAISCAAGYEHSMVLLNDGSLYTWGANFYGQLGIGSTTNERNAPAQVPLSNVAFIAAGVFTSAAITNVGDLYMWGDSYFGQVGNGSPLYASTPQRVLSGVYRVACGANHTVAVKNDGTVWAWGSNRYGQLGNGATGGAVNVPQQVPGLTNVYQVDAGDNFILASKTDGTVWAWGRNDLGQLGIGNNVDQSTPTRIYGLIGGSGVAQISARNVSAAAMLNDGSVFGWGDNSLGQLGTIFFTTSNQPTYCFACNNVTAISMGDTQMMALINDLSAVVGHITLEGINPSAPPQVITFETRPDSSSHPIYTQAVSVGADGVYSLYPVQMDTGTLRIKGHKYLAANIAYDTRKAPMLNADVTLLTGDANNDNSVDSTDFGLLIGAFNTSAADFGSGYELSIDFNSDGFIDSTDFGLLIGNFNMVGAN